MSAAPSLGIRASRSIRHGETILKEEALITTYRKDWDDLQDLFDALPAALQEEYMSLYDRAENDELPSKTVRGIFATNSYSGENEFGGSIFSLTSRFNHSCTPNAYVTFVKDDTATDRKTCPPEARFR